MYSRQDWIKLVACWTMGRKRATIGTQGCKSNVSETVHRPHADGRLVVRESVSSESLISISLKYGYNVDLSIKYI